MEGVRERPPAITRYPIATHAGARTERTPATPEIHMTTSTTSEPDRVREGAGDAGRGYIESLTPLRGVAALWVVAYHFDAIVDHLAPRTTGLVSRGYLWVDFFFLLSGFVICHVYGDRLSGPTRGRELRPYVAARFSRIYPLHLFALLLLVGLWWGAPLAAPALARSLPYGTFTPATLPQNLALVHAHGTTPGISWNVPSWSIAAEWWTYLVAVFLVPLVHARAGWRAGAAVVLGTAGLTALERLHPGGSLDVTFDYGWLRCLLGFVVGVGLYQAYRAGVGARVLRTDAAFAAAGLLVLTLLHRTPADALLVPAFSLLLLAAARNAGRASRLLATRPMRFLGEVSYSVYLMQGVWLVVLWFGLILHTGRADAFGNFGTPLRVRLVLFAGVAALTVGSAVLTHRYVEVPARGWLRRRTARHEARRLTAPAHAAGGLSRGVAGP
jgi:peptidoglycan/LPS O-acetylase OafA/YrhL